ncbi:DUF748 domain-containing protein [Chitinibacteraceae bacterium HSL-7]
MKALHRFKPTKLTLIRGLIGLGIALTTIAVTGFWAIPHFGRPYLEQLLSEQLQRQVSIGQLSLNPFTLTAQLDKVQIRETDGRPFVAVSQLRANAELWSIFVGGPVVRSLAVTEPDIRISRIDTARFNFSDIVERFANEPDDGEPATFSINNIEVHGGRIELDDQVTKTRHVLARLEAAIPFLSTLSYKLDDYVEPKLSGTLNQAAFKLTGRSKPFGEHREATLDLKLDHLSIPNYVAYLPLPQRWRVAAGTLDGQLEFAFVQHPEPQLLVRGRSSISQFSLQQQDQPLLRFKRLDVNLGTLEPLKSRYRVGRVILSEPEVWLNRDHSGWRDLPVAPASDTKAAPSPSPYASIAGFELRNGQVHFADATTQPAAQVVLSGINLSAEALDPKGKKPSNVQLSLQGPEQAKLHVNGQLDLQTSGATASIQAQAWPLAPFAPYLAPYLNGKLNAFVGAQLNVQAGANGMVLSDSALELSQVMLEQPGAKAPSIQLGALTASEIALNSQQKQIDIGAINASEADVRLVRERGGQLNLASIIKAQPASPPSTPPWQYRIAQLSLAGSQLQFANAELPALKPLQIQDIRAQISDIRSNGGKATLTLDAKGSANGRYHVSGWAQPRPLVADLKLDLGQIDLAHLQPYIDQYVNLRVASLFGAAKGQLELNTEPTLKVRYRGDVRLSKMHALDKQSGDDLLKWRTLDLRRIDTRSDPLSIRIGEAALDRFYSRLILQPDARFNLQHMLVSESGAQSLTREGTTPKPVTAAKESKPASKPLPPIRIDQITLTQGNINFSDLFIRPNYTANLTEMAGSIKGLSTQPGSRANLDLRGSVDKLAPAEVSGQINPLADPLFVDVKASVRGYDLTATSTYSAKYAGYGITKGKLSMDVSYFIENQQLKANNQLFLDQLTLSDKPSGSPDAIKAPVKLALSLLTDRRGQIKLNLPVTGSLDDPQFSVGAVIWQIIGNLLEKVVTAPFDAIASAFGDKPLQSYVAFKPGLAELGAQAQADLQPLPQLLDDRPALKLDITGWVDPELDREGLKQVKLEQKLRALKAERTGERGESVDEHALQVTDDERAELLAAVYKKEKFAKPRNAVGLAKKLPSDEMTQLILANTEISDDDLRQLALARALAVKRTLESAGVDQARLFVIAPKLDANARDVKEGASTRADLGLTN